MKCDAACDVADAAVAAVAVAAAAIGEADVEAVAAATRVAESAVVMLEMRRGYMRRTRIRSGMKLLKRPAGERGRVRSEKWDGMK